MAVMFGMGVGMIYGGLFAVLVGTMVPLLAQAKPALVARMAGGPRFTLLATAVLYVGILYWGLVGALFGGLFLLIERARPQGGWGTPNIVYTVVIVLLALLVAIPVLLFVRRTRIQVAILLGAFSIIFGWVLPILGA